MNPKTYFNPANPREKITTRDFDTARSLKLRGWREVEATITPAKPDAKR
jgi:hypothetical protein